MFSNENYTSCFFPQKLLMTIGSSTHEVDSIIDIKGPKNSKDQVFRLEMCCQCCKGRVVKYKK